MSTPPIEQDVILDADGKPLFDALQYVQREINKIQNAVKTIQQDSYKSANDFGKVVSARTKELQTAISQMRTLSTAKNTPGALIQDLNSDKKLARATAEATKYARELAVARNTAEAIDAKIASINKRMSERGAKGQLATLGQTDQVKKLEQAAQAVKKLDSQFQALQTRARQTGGDFSAQIREIMNARQALFSAASNPRRVNLGPEIIGVTDAQQRLANNIADARARETANLRAGYQVRKEIAIAEVAGLRTATELERARVASNARIVSLREQLRTAATSESKTLLEQLEIEKARGRQITQNIRGLEQESRAGISAAAASKNGPSRLQNILTPGYAAAAFARTGIYGVAAAAAYGTFNTVQNSLQNIVQLEDELAKLQAISNSTEEQMQSLKASIFDVGSTSRYSTVDLVKISQTLAQAGVSASQMTDVLKAVTTLATASGSTPDEAVQLVTSALGSFQLQASEAARVADLMTNALNRTKLTVQQTGQAIQYVGSTAYEQNISLEQLLATIGAVAQAGVRSGSTIGTGFRQFLVDLQSPSEKLTTTLKNLGLSSADVDVKVRGLPAVLETLRDRGFGAAQAYDSLETRAAAFYLTAKNNTDIMDQLQLSFQTSGAAMAANERAMSSLTAQWQRFKNILSEGFDDSMQLPMQILKDLITGLSDSITEMRAESARMAERRAGGVQGYINRAGGGITGTAQGLLEYENENLIPDTVNSLYKLQNAALDLLTPQFYFGGKGMGQMWSEYTEGASRAINVTNQLATAVNTSAEKVENQRNRIGELDQEIQRLITQKASLRDNDTRSAAETATLTSRFQGLAVYLGTTKNKYDDLTQAAIAYRNAQLGLLSTDLLAQQSALTTQSGEADRTAVSGINRIRNNPSLVKKLTKPEFNALGELANGNRGDDQRAMGILADAVSRLTKEDPALAREINTIVQAVGQMTTNTAQITAIALERKRNVLDTSPYGQDVSKVFRDVDAAISQMGSATRADQAKLAAQARSSLDWLEKNSKERLGRQGPETTRQYIKQAIQDISSRRAQIGAILAPTKAETKAENALEPQPKITRADVVSVVQSLGLGTRIGSGYRTPAEQDALHARGVTNATGATGTHSSGLGQDFPLAGKFTKAEQDQIVTRVKTALTNAGMAPDEVRFETGGGKNNGTGQHVHVGYRKNRRRSNASNAGATAAVNLDKLALNSLDDQLDTRLKDLSKATSDSVFEASEASARQALDAWETQLKELTGNEIAKQGLNASDADERLRQMRAQIKQKRDEFEQKISDAIIKNLENQLAAAQAAFNLSLRPFEQRLSQAQGQVSGLDYYSNRNKVPDYTRTLAQNRVAQAAEARDKARLASLPTLIDSDQEALKTAQERLAKGGLSDAQVEQTKLKIDQLTLSVQQLIQEREALEAAFSVKGLIPTTFSEGIDQAIEAYRQTHDMTSTLKQDIINNLGGAFEATNDGLTTLFTNILNGSQSALQAFGNFAKGIIDYMIQIAAKAAATQVMGLLLKLVGSAFGSQIGASASTGTEASDAFSSVLGSGSGGPTFGGGAYGNVMTFGSFNGGPAIEGLKTGGEVTNGDVTKDSVYKKLAKGEWVVNKTAVDSVGNEFMANLNNHGSKAIAAMQGLPQINFLPKQEMSVYVVPPQSNPGLSKDDVLITWQEDVLKNGETRKLIKYVAQGG